MMAMIPAVDWFAVYADTDGTMWAEPLVAWFAHEEGGVGPIPLVTTLDGTAASPGRDCIAILHRTQMPLAVQVRKITPTELKQAWEERERDRRAEPSA